MAVPRMHDDEVAVEPAAVVALLRRDQPELAGLPLTRLDTWGTDHVIYRLGERLAARFPRIDWAAEQGERDQRWLGVLAPALPVHVPVPAFVGQPGFGYPFRWYVVPWIEGAVADPRTTDLPMLARDLAAFVRALQAVELGGAPLIGAGRRGGPLCAVDADTVASAERLRGETDVDALLAVWRTGVEAPAYSGPPRWVHGDLMDGNLLLRDGRLSAVIDWGGLGAGDPAVDLMIAWTLFDAPARAVYRDGLGCVDEAMWLRGRAWATSAALMALPYYRLTNPDIVARFWRCVTAVLEDVRRG